VRLDSRRALALLVVAGCGAHPPEEGVSRSFSIRVEGEGLLYMAVGDSLKLGIDSTECHGDFCLAALLETAPFRWSTDAPEVASIDGGAVLRAHRPGWATIAARDGGRRASDSVRVLPPVASIGWRPWHRAAAVGDTLRVSVVALDSAGSEVARLPVHSHLRGTGRSGQMLDWGGATPAAFWLDSAGSFLLVARLAHRWDTLRVPVYARAEGDTANALAGVPQVGARVRVMAAGFGDGWQVGMFSQTRTVPPHYLVLIFAEGPVSRVERSIPIGAITRLQVSAAQPGPRGPISYAAAPVRADERWLEMVPNGR
jgi:hypothetical protein